MPSDVLLGFTTNIWMQESLLGYNYHKITFKIKVWKHEEYETQGKASKQIVKLWPCLHF